MVGWKELALVIHPDDSQRFGEFEAVLVDYGTALDQGLDSILDEIRHGIVFLLGHNTSGSVQVRVPTLWIPLSFVTIGAAESGAFVAAEDKPVEDGGPDGNGA